MPARVKQDRSDQDGAHRDGVDRIVAQWATERPGLDVSPMQVFGRLARANRLMEQRLDSAFSRHGLDSGSFDVLATLLRAGPPHRLTAGALQRSAMITSSAVAQRLNRLESRGFVTRSQNPDDARATDVTLTEGGRTLIGTALPDHVANEHRLLHGLSARQRTELAALLRSLIQSIEGAAPLTEPD
jgi:DNA-binding MarR family transcriptional regulator